MMNNNKKAPLKATRKSALEIANQMYKDAWLVKWSYFKRLNPKFTTEQLNAVTSQYFINLKD